MAKKRYKKKKSVAGKVIMGLSVAVIITGIGVGTFLALDKSEVSAQTPTEETEKTEGILSAEELETKIAELEASKTDLQAKITTLTSDKTNLEAEISELEKTIVANQASIGSLNGQITNLDEQITALRAEKLALEESNSANEEKIAELDASIESLESEKAALQAEVTSKQETITELNNQIAELNKGKYTLTFENEELNLTRADYEIEGFKSDVTSLDGEGNVVDFNMVEVPINYENGIQTVRQYYFNGNSENGNYATRIVNISDKNVDVTLKGIAINEYDPFQEGNMTITFADFSLTNLSTMYTFDDSMYINVKITNISTGELQTLSGFRPTVEYTLEQGNYYSVEIPYKLKDSNGTFRNFSQTYLISTNTSGVYRIDEGTDVSIVSSGINSNGNFEIMFNANGVEGFTLVVPGEALASEDFTLLQNNCSATTSDGTALNVYGAGLGDEYGIVTQNTIIEHDSGNINLNLDVTYMKKEYAKWIEEQNKVMFVATNIAYNINEEGFTDTPQVTDIYNEGENTIIVFNGFGQVENKLSISKEDISIGSVVLADGNTESAVYEGMISGDSSELVVSVNYGAGNAKLYITLAVNA